LPKLCFAEAGSALDEVNKQVLQHNGAPLPTCPR
jgi:hypothetical protein